MPRALSVVLLVIVSFGQLAAQDGESNALDLRTRKAIQVFVKDVMEIAIEYEQNGDLQKAKNMYEQIQRLDSRIAGVGQKIEHLNEKFRPRRCKEEWNESGVSIRCINRRLFYKQEAGQTFSDR